MRRRGDGALWANQRDVSTLTHAWTDTPLPYGRGSEFSEIQNRRFPSRPAAPIIPPAARPLGITFLAMPFTLSSQPNALRNSAPFDTPLAALLVAVGFLITLVFGALSTGYHHVDDLTHFLFARWAWRWPSYLLHEWGRPGFTTLYFIPSWFGWHAARAWSALLAAGTAWMAFRIAQHVGLRRAWLVPVLLYVQPLFFTLALTTLTETALGFYLVAAVLLALRNHWSAAAAVYSLGLIARHEAVVLVPIFLLAALAARQPLKRLWPFVWAPILLNLLAWIAGLQPSLALFFHPAATGQYGHGGWYEFFARTLHAFGPAVAALGLAGIKPMLRRKGGPFIVALVVVFFLAQMLVRMLGLYDSGGYARFLVPIGPLWAILAVAAWNRFTASEGRVRVRATAAVTLALLFLWMTMELQVWLHPETVEITDLWKAKLALRFATAAVALVAVAVWLSAGGPRREAPAPSTWTMRFALAAMMVLAWVGLCGVLRPGSAEVVMDEELAWLHANGYDNRPVIAAHLWIDYRRGSELSPRRPGFAGRIDQAPAGAIVIWDSKFAPYDSDRVLLGDMTARNTAFQLLHVGRAIDKRPPDFYVFEKLVEGAVFKAS